MPAAQESSDDQTSGDELIVKRAVKLWCRKEAGRPRCLCHTVLVVLTLTAGVGELIIVEHLTITEAIYVIVQIVTTVGYGDIPPKKNFTRLFIALYALWLLVLVAYFVNTIVQMFLDRQSEHIKKRLRHIERILDEQVSEEHEAGRKYGALNNLIATSFVFVCHVLFGTIFFGLWEHCVCSYGQTHHADCDVYDRCEKGQHKDFLQAFYMSVITLTTVGFGDYTPASRVGRLVAIFWMISGIASTGFFLDALQTVFLKWEVDRKFNDAEEMSEEIFHQMDRDGNGTLSRGEFCNYVLVKHNLVDQETIDDICDIYDRMDKMNPECKNAVSYDEVRTFQARIRNFKDAADE